MASIKQELVPNLGRGLAILEYLATHSRGATITELVERLGYPSASVFRMTALLAELGYLSRDPATKKYVLTNKLLLLGRPSGLERGLVEASLGPMRGVWRATGETTQLCCLNGTHVVVLEQILAIHPFKYSTDLGARCPCYSCAPGKAILAALPEDDREALVKRIKFKRFTSTTIASPGELREELNSIAGCGYALDRAEGLEGIRCVAAAIRNHQGHPVGALTVAGPAYRIPESDFERLGLILIEAAGKAEERYSQ